MTKALVQAAQAELGPWSAFYSNSGRIGTQAHYYVQTARIVNGRKIGDCVRVIADILPRPRDEDDLVVEQATALLIAAAPSMLKALRFFVSEYDLDPATWPDADAAALRLPHAAILEAEGRS